MLISLISPYSPHLLFLFIFAISKFLLPILQGERKWETVKGMMTSLLDLCQKIVHSKGKFKYYVNVKKRPLSYQAGLFSKDNRSL